MEEIYLKVPSEEDEKYIMEYLKEHNDNGEYVLNGDGGLDELKDFKKWLTKIRNDVTREELPKRVKASLYILKRKNDNKVIGMIQIRHSLNDYLYNYGGNIGYGICPSERRKGYGKIMLKLALEKVKELDLKKVLITCDKDNLASAGVIKANGGVLENEVKEGSEIVQRYWIKI